MTPLMAAAKRGQKDVVKVLLANGADVTAISIKVYNVVLPVAVRRTVCLAPLVYLCPGP